MSAAQHTPGPWHHLDLDEVVPSDEDGFPHDELRICFMATAGGDPAAPERIEANARLIAAAPELLEALAKAELFILGFEDDELQDGMGVLLAEIAGAIAKARGQ